jgi:glycosyltransferase involved in cell wall biosynthesis
MKILLLYKGYPRISHSYQIVEANELNKKHELMIVSFEWELFTKSNNHLPYVITSSPLKEIDNIIKFKPDVIHSHYLDTIDICTQLSKQLKIPFTIKSHSFDILSSDCKQYIKLINDNMYCLKIIAFPEFVERLSKIGVKKSKLLPMYPTLDINLFINLEIENGPHIMSGGAFLPKKNIKGFILLSKKIKQLYPEKQITYYSVMENKSYYNEILQFNRIHGNPVNFLTVQPDKMPMEYKKHQWLIYTACSKLKTVGNPLMVAEAQASGVGVIMYKLRDTLIDYVTENGYLYNTDEEVLEIISQNFDEYKRNKAIEISKRYDMKEKIKDIENVWSS